MGSFRRVFASAALAVGGLTCTFPTDRSDEVVVLITSASTVVIRGQELPLAARALRVSGGDTTEIRNTDFLWSTADASVATVQGVGVDSADVTGVNSGLVQIAARAVAFEQAEPGYVQVRVSNALEVDSIRPRIVRFGDTVTVYGVGVDSIFLASLGNATLLDYPIPFLLPTRTRDAQGYATATFWVPPPARPDRLSYIGPGVFGEAPESTFVQQFDALEPNELAPRQIDLDVDPPRFPQLPFLLFYNPALAFEALPRDATGIDWYRFEQSSARDLTLVLGGSGVNGTFQTYLTDSLEFDPTDSTFTIGPTSWTLGPGSNACQGFPFTALQLQPESTIVALHDMPAGVLHSVSIYKQAGHYALRVNAGYGVTDPKIPRDHHEEDDFCTAAGARTSVVSVPGSTLRDTLTIDNPHDIDWIRFTVTSTQVVTLKLAAIAGASDSSDVDLYVLTVPGGGASAALQERGRSVKLGSNETLTLNLAAGDYYAVVMDYVGRPVQYQLCIDGAAGAPCGAFPNAPAAARPADRATIPVAAPLRTARD